MKRYFIQLQFKGTNYHGWQIQENAVTVQEVLNKALSTLLHVNIETTGAGRTDAGVHAKYFVAHFDFQPPLPYDKETFIYKLNSILSKDICIDNVFEVKPDAHSRFNALSRTYKYFIGLSKEPFNEEYVLYTRLNLDINILNSFSKLLKEYSDFTSFARLHGGQKTNTCNITYAHWEIIENQIVFTITADRFLRNMVRSIVGTLLLAGSGKLSKKKFIEIIEAKNRNMAGTSADAKGLFLTHIEYNWNEILI